MRTTAVSLEIREATVFYGANRVLDRVSLSAAGGEFIALLGASGCGKTTLLRAICGFVGLASGSIVVGGQDVTRLSPEKRNIAMVFQSYALWPHMTVAQNIGYGLKLRHVGRADIDARIDELLAMLRLDEELKGSFILAADTVVAVGRRILPKAELLDEAAQCLRLLSGRNHRVHSAVCLVTPNEAFRQRLDQAGGADDRFLTLVAAGRWTLYQAVERRILAGVQQVAER